KENNLYVTDFGENTNVQKFDPAGNFLMSFGSPGTRDGQFNNPADVAVDSNGNIFVSDSSNNRIQKFDPAGNFLMKFGVFGSGNGQFQAPMELALDSSDNVYVA